MENPSHSNAGRQCRTSKALLPERLPHLTARAWEKFRRQENRFSFANCFFVEESLTEIVRQGANAVWGLGLTEAQLGQFVAVRRLAD